MKFIHDLLVFNRCAKLKNFTQAAISLSLTPSAVVKVIQKIEDYYDVKLFQRSTRAVELTEYGEILFQHSNKIIFEMQEVEEQYQILNDQSSGRLKISMPNVENIFTDSLCTFMKLYPNIKLDITFTDQYVDLISDRYDIVIRFGKLDDSALVAKSLGKLKMLVLHAPTYKPNFKERKRNHYLIYKYPNTGKLEIYKGFENDIEHSNCIILNSITSIKNLCLQGHGMALLPHLLVQKELKNKSLVALSDHSFEEKEMHIMWAKSGGISPKKRLFINYFTNYFDSSRG